MDEEDMWEEHLKRAMKKREHERWGQAMESTRTCCLTIRIVIVVHSAARASGRAVASHGVERTMAKRNRERHA